VSNEYDGMFEWICPKCNTKNRNEVDYAMNFTCECDECGSEFEIYLDVEVSIDNIIEVK